jgi:hypothetical protein
LQAPPAPPPFIASVGGVAVSYQLGPRLNAMRVKTSPVFEMALVLVRLDHVASLIGNADHSIM